MSSLWKDVDLKIDDEKIPIAFQSRLVNFTNNRDPFENISSTEPCLKVWKVHKYRIYYCPESEYGQFYETGAYIILSGNILDTSVMEYNIHCWIGKSCSLDDYVASIFGSDQLDQRLNLQCIIHKEIQDRESDLFNSYFQPLTILKTPSSYPRLLEIYKPKETHNNIRVRQIHTTIRNLSSYSVYVLDDGNRICQWIGRYCRFGDLCMRYVEELKANRGPNKIKVDMVDESTLKSHYFFKALKYDEDKDDFQSENSLLKPKCRGVYAVDTSTRPPTFKLVRGTKNKRNSVIHEHSLTIFDTPYHTFLIMSEDGFRHKNFGLQYLHHFLRGTDHPLVPCTVLMQGQKSAALERYLIN